jgi:Cytochrome oxidase complex assembly protein 1
MENVSGLGPQSTVPAEIDKWNWGAFLLNWIWGIGNNTFIALLMFVPFANFVMPFVLGAKGSAWAWKNKKWQSIDEFKAVQRKWAKWGVFVLMAFIGLFIALFSIIALSLKSSEPYKFAVSKLQSSQKVSRVIGSPFTTGMPSGSMQMSGPDGRANISFSITGPSGSGTVYMEATKNLGQWQIHRMVLEQASGDRMDITTSSSVALPPTVANGRP